MQGEPSLSAYFLKNYTNFHPACQEIVDFSESASPVLDRAPVATRTDAQVRQAHRSGQTRFRPFRCDAWADSTGSYRYKRERARGSADFQWLDETVGQERFLLLPY
jgi:hypothetical protein